MSEILTVSCLLLVPVLVPVLVPAPVLVRVPVLVLVLLGSEEVVAEVSTTARPKLFHSFSFSCLPACLQHLLTPHLPVRLIIRYPTHLQQTFLHRQNAYQRHAVGVREV